MRTLNYLTKADMNITGLIEPDQRGQLKLVKDAQTSIAEEAKNRLDTSTLQIGQLVCSLAVGDNRDLAYKIFKVNDTTVEIALPDLVMVTVSKDSLYDPNDAVQIFWERVGEAQLTKI